MRNGLPGFHVMIVCVRPVLFGVVLCLSGCGGSPSQTKPAAAQPTPAPAPAAAPAVDAPVAVIATMRGFSEQMCTCVDKACTAKVADDMARWGQGQAQAAAGAKLSEDEVKQISAISETMTRCMIRAMSAKSQGASHGSD